VLEIGAGLGNLTCHLAETANRITAVETDRRLFPLLKQACAAFDNITLVEGDIMRIALDQLQLPADYLVVANIPYYLTSALLRRLLEAQKKPRRIVLTVQQEVAHRICAAEGDLSLLAISVRVYGSASIAFHIPAGAFYPQPEVDSAVIRIDLYDTPLVESGKLDEFFALAKAGFGQKRKTLLNSISAGMGWDKQRAGETLSQAGIKPERRAQTLTLQEWAALARTVSKK